MVCASLSACSTLGKISPENRAAIHRVQILSPPNGAQASLYSDTTSDVARNAVGGLLGASIAEANSQAGVKRWKPITNGQEAFVLANVRSAIAKKFQEGHAIDFSEGEPADANLIIEFLSYGIRHVGDQRFSVLGSLSVRLQKPDGKTVWRYQTTALAPGNYPIAEFQSRRDAFTYSVRDVALQLGAQLTSAY